MTGLFGRHEVSIFSGVGTECSKCSSSRSRWKVGLPVCVERVVAIAHGRRSLVEAGASEVVHLVGNVLLAVGCHCGLDFLGADELYARCRCWKRTYVVGTISVVERERAIRWVMTRVSGSVKTYTQESLDLQSETELAKSVLAVGIW